MQLHEPFGGAQAQEIDIFGVGDQGAKKRPGF